MGSFSSDSAGLIGALAHGTNSLMTLLTRFLIFGKAHFKSFFLVYVKLKQLMAHEISHPEQKRTDKILANIQ
jgi:hypothetical protein